MDYKKEIPVGEIPIGEIPIGEIPFGTFDSELMHQEIFIPEGFEATIDGDKIIITRKESKDEKVRKAIIELVRQSSEILDMQNQSNMLAWLEKQSEHKRFRDSIQVGDNVTKNEYDELVNLSQLNRVAKRDADILKKQDEQKETLCDKCKKEQPSHSCQDITTLGRCYIESMNTSNNTSNKNKPKFHEGDWVVINGFTIPILITDVHNDLYDTIFANGKHRIYDTNVIDKDAHLWTIQDAKDCDVLAGSKGEAILIFRGIGNTEWDDVIDYYCYYNCHREDFIVQENVEYWGNTENCQLKPATKEQCDQLKKAMADAGWEFDFEKKELKKIEEKTLTDIENAMITDFEDAMMHIGKSFFGKNAGLDPNNINMIKEQANTLLGLVPNKDWSEDDVYNSKLILSTISQDQDLSLETKDKLTSWLKSIRGKVKPQWKPSNKQMNALDSTLQYNQVSHSSFEHLNSLYNDLKKLC